MNKILTATALLAPLRGPHSPRFCSVQEDGSQRGIGSGSPRWETTVGGGGGGEGGDLYKMFARSHRTRMEQEVLRLMTLKCEGRRFRWSAGFVMEGSPDRPGTLESRGWSGNWSREARAPRETGIISTTTGDMKPRLEWKGFCDGGGRSRGGVSRRRCRRSCCCCWWRSELSWCTGWAASSVGGDGRFNSAPPTHTSPWHQLHGGHMTHCVVSNFLI